MAPIEHELTARIDDLEMKVTFQDDVIETLNKTVVQQWHLIEQLQRRTDRLEQRLREAHEATTRDASEEPPPPHY